MKMNPCLLRSNLANYPYSKPNSIGKKGLILMKKIRVGIICGGQSAEHEVSLQSAKNIIEAIDREKYEVAVIGIDKAGRWSPFNETSFLLHADDPKQITLKEATEFFRLQPGGSDDKWLHVSGAETVGDIDVFFPVLHGPMGEDGTVQGLLKLANKPFVGAGVLGSAVGMDKDVMKRLLRDAKVPIGDFLVLHHDQRDDIHFDEIKTRLGTPVFIKPANYGSSVGIHKVHDEDTFEGALKDAFSFDRKVVVEAFIEGRELECSVLGNSKPMASVPGEIIPRKDFYSYEAKYIDEEGAYLKIPAELKKTIVHQIQDLAVKTFKVLCCKGMARVDFFLKKNNDILVNEINTIPGFTKISMYPRLWKESGIRYSELIDRLIQLALERYEP
jgi:D-alanine-D-alanine ligase